MKTLILLFLLSFKTYAYEIAISPLTLHTVTRSQYFYNSITKNGELIANPVISIGDGKNFILTGKDSSGINMAGYYYKYPSNWIVGAYTHYTLGWDRNGDYSFHIPLTKNIGLIPIVGYKQQIELTKDIKLDIVYSPLVFNFAISFKI